MRGIRLLVESVLVCAPQGQSLRASYSQVTAPWRARHAHPDRGRGRVLRWPRIRPTGTCRTRLPIGTKVRPIHIADLHARYWSLPKSVREDFGLRPEGPSYGYNGDLVLGQAKDLLFSALADRYPPRGDSLTGNEKVLDADGAIAWMDSNLAELAAKLVLAEDHVNREH